MRNVIKFKEITSTNDYVKDHIEELIDECIVLADIQTRGRGRSNHSWISEQGNLFMTKLLKDRSREDSFNVLIKVSLSLIDLLNEYGITATIKYPNDILVNGKKISGVLIESKGYDKLDYLIAGIGLNVNQVDFGELNNKATSMSKVIGKNFDLDNIFSDFWDIFDSQKISHKRYVSNSLIIGRKISYNDQLYTVENIDSEGNLVLNDGRSEIRVKINEISLEEIYNEINN